MLEQLDIFSLFADTTTKKVDIPTKKADIPTNNAKRTTANATSSNGLWTGVPEQTINDLLLLGSGFSNGKKRIYDFFCKEKDEQKRADMLKKEYGIGGSGLHWGYWIGYDAKGFEISDNKHQNKLLLSWRNVAERIGKLIHYHLYYA